LKQISLGWAQADELRSAIAGFESRQRPVYAYLEQPDNLTYYLGTAASKIAVPPAATLELVGLRGEVFFFAKLFQHLGIEPELFNVGDYKSAAEIFQRMSLSSAHRRMTDAILTDIQTRLSETFAERLGDGNFHLEELTNSGPLSARQALNCGLVDFLAYEDELMETMKKDLETPSVLPASKYRIRDGYFKRLVTFRRPQIAILHAEGMISTGESHRGQGRLPVLGSRTLIGLLKDARKRKRIKAIVLRINSPGGSGLASDLIWHEVKKTASEKPVVVSFGNVAASGGYYIATGGGTIFADPSTLTGSIGVIGGKFNISKLLGSLGITVDSVDKGDASGYASITRPFRGREAEAFQDHLVEFYEKLFLKRVAEHRSCSVKEIRPAAEGRVWTGLQALEKRLIDRVGGLTEALQEAKAQSGLVERKVRIVTYAHRRSFRDLLPLQLAEQVARDPVMAIAPDLPRIHQ
jgi:protease-4